MDKIKYILLIAAAFVILLRVLIYILRRRSKNKCIQTKAEDKLREEALDRVLIGKKGKTDDHGSASVPFDVKYDLDQRKQKEKGKHGKAAPSRIMLQITQHSELSTRKYMLHVDHSITFGNRLGQNDIVISGSNITARHCEIFRLDDKLYIKKLSPVNNVSLQRGKRNCSVENEAVALRSKDRLTIGTYTYDILILQS